MDLTETLGAEGSRTPHGRPRNLERARTSALWAHSASAVLQSLPAGVDGSLHLIVFVWLVHWLQTQPWPTVKDLLWPASRLGMSPPSAEDVGKAAASFLLHTFAPIPAVVSDMVDGNMRLATLQARLLQARTEARLLYLKEIGKHDEWHYEHYPIWQFWRYNEVYRVEDRAADLTPAERTEMARREEAAARRVFPTAPVANQPMSLHDALFVAALLVIGLKTGERALSGIASSLSAGVVAKKV